MNDNNIVKQTVEHIKPNHVFLAGQLYKEKLSDRMTEMAFFKTVERLCKEGILLKVAQGTYCRAKKGKFGMLPPSESDIVNSFTKNNTGMTIGYSLYNSLQLTTQIGKNVEVLTSCIEQGQKTIGNIHLVKCMIDFEPEVQSVIRMLEILENFDKIQDLNIRRLLAYADMFSETYTDETFSDVYYVRKYAKRTIAFLAEFLDYYGIRHSLKRYLSSLSEYKYPRVEALYEFAYE